MSPISDLLYWISNFMFYNHTFTICWTSRMAGIHSEDLVRLSWTGFFWQGYYFLSSNWTVRKKMWLKLFYTNRNKDTNTKKDKNKDKEYSPKEAFVLEWDCLEKNIRGGFSTNQFGGKPKVRLKMKTKRIFCGLDHYGWFIPDKFLLWGWRETAWTFLWSKFCWRQDVQRWHLRVRTW